MNTGARAFNLLMRAIIFPNAVAGVCMKMAAVSGASPTVFVAVGVAAYGCGWLIARRLYR